MDVLENVGITTAGDLEAGPGHGKITMGLF